MALLRCPDCGKEYSSRLDACPDCQSPASAAETVSPSSGGSGGRRKMRDADLSAATLRGWLEDMIFKEKYQLIRKLGRGSFGEVWKAKDLEASDEERDVYVALKLLPPEISGSPVEVTRVRKNFQQVHELHHQNIVAHLAIFQDNNECALAMEFVDGVTLGKYRLDFEDRHGAFPLGEALRICRQIAEGLDYAHDRKVAHRDIKPENIMITGRGEVKILDFGLAAEIRSSMSRVSRQLLEVSGTRPYIAPEQWQGKAPSPASDQYALAAVLYELLSGHPPFEIDDAVILRECVLRDLPDGLPSLTPEQNSALLRALAKKSSERFANCMEFIDVVNGGLKEIKPVVEYTQESKRKGKLYSAKITQAKHEMQQERRIIARSALFKELLKRFRERDMLSKATLFCVFWFILSTLIFYTLQKTPLILMDIY